MNDVQANGGIDDINARYNTKMDTDVVYEGVRRHIFEKFDLLMFFGGL